MKDANREKVEKYFREDGSWESGVVLFNSLPGHSLAFSRQLNHKSNNPSNLKELHYHIARLVNMGERDIQLAKTKVAEQPQEEKASGSGAEMNYFQLRKFFQDNNIEVENWKKETLEAAYQQYLDKQKNAESASGVKSPETDPNTAASDANTGNNPEGGSSEQNAGAPENASSKEGK